MNRRVFNLSLAAAGLSPVWPVVQAQSPGDKSAMNILIKAIPHSEQRYPTVGDWYTTSTRTKDFDQKGEIPNPKDTLQVRMSIMSDWRYEALVAVHELVEALLCARAGVTPKMVDQFDMSWKGEGEPGDDPRAPYFAQHQAATAIEKQFANYLGVDWQAYEKEVDSL